jgi:hypothetical protein
MKTKTAGDWATYAANATLTVAPYMSTVVAAAGTGYRGVDYLYTSGANTPNYRSLLAQGKLIPFTPFVQYKRTGEGINEWDLYPSTWPTSGTHEYTTGSGVVLSSWYSAEMLTLQAMAEEYSTDVYVQAAAAKLSQGRADALTFLAEWHKTIAMFEHIGKSLLDLARGWFKSNQKTPIDLWLQARYGWRPLIYDIKSFTDAVINWDERKKRRSERSGFTHKWVETSQSNGEDARRVVTDELTDSYEVSLRGSVVADFQPISLSPLQFNPLTTAWELVRFSFVVDWFLSVGAALGALSFLYMNTDYVSAGGIRIKHTRAHVRTSTAKPGNYFASATGHTNSTSVYQIRTPAPVTSFPQVRFKLDMAKVLDLWALLAQTVFGLRGGSKGPSLRYHS